MSKQTRYLLTVDSATGAAVKLERVGEAGDLTEVPLSTLSMAPPAGVGPLPMPQQLMNFMAVPQMPAMFPFVVPAYVCFMGMPVPMPLASFAPPVAPGASMGFTGPGAPGGPGMYAAFSGPGAPGGPGVYATLSGPGAPGAPGGQTLTQTQGPGGPGVTTTATQGPGAPGGLTGGTQGPGGTSGGGEGSSL
jgi:hypothetical protein